MRFRKSTFSFANGNCVEAGENFRKSTFSFANGNCVEVGNDPVVVLVRDTADRDGSVLAFSAGAWAAFTNALEL